jgi:hypothetical protein
MKNMEEEMKAYQDRYEKNEGENSKLNDYVE